MQILWVFETDVFIVQKGSFSNKNAENRFFTISLQELLHGDTGGYKRWKGGTGGNKG